MSIRVCVCVCVCVCMHAHTHTHIYGGNLLYTTCAEVVWFFIDSKLDPKHPVFKLLSWVLLTAVSTEAEGILEITINSRSFHTSTCHS